MRLKYENVTQFYSTHFNPMFHFYTPPKTSENKRFSPVFREGGGGTEMGHWAKNKCVNSTSTNLILAHNLCKYTLANFIRNLTYNLKFGATYNQPHSTNTLKFEL